MLVILYAIGLYTKIEYEDYLEALDQKHEKRKYKVPNKFIIELMEIVFIIFIFKLNNLFLLC